MVGIAVSQLQAVNSLKETNNGRMSWALPHSGQKLDKIRLKYFFLLPKTLHILRQIVSFKIFFIYFLLIKDEKGTPFTIYIIDLILPCWTYSPSRGLCEFLALLVAKQLYEPLMSVCIYLGERSEEKKLWKFGHMSKS